MGYGLSGCPCLGKLMNVSRDASVARRDDWESDRVPLFAEINRPFLFGGWVGGV